MQGTPYALPRDYRPRKRTWPDKRLEKTPAWCAVDLRDGNQALPNPLDPEQKRQYLKLLLDIGFKEIEIGFPAASLDEWVFCRDVIEKRLVPPDATISVLTQARGHIIRKTMKALAGAAKAICHVYVPCSELHDKYVLGESPRQIARRTIESVRLVGRMAGDMEGSDIRLEFSPEEFTDSNLDFTLELCELAVAEWRREHNSKVIVNLPQTVERSIPTHYADMIEAFLEGFSQKKNCIISLHAHNDMGGAVASTELALLAGGERVEGTLFGNGERSGNLDLVTLAMNLHCMNIDTGLDLSRIDDIKRTVSDLTSMPVPPRQPYSGSLVFTAFSGSHQDAIHKGLDRIPELTRHFHGWKVPYLHVNPADVGRSFSEAIRINSQSGRGGIAYVLEEAYGIKLPAGLLAELAQAVQTKADTKGKELKPKELWDIFLAEFSGREWPIKLLNYWPRPDVSMPSRIHSEVHLEMKGKPYVLHSSGDGPVSAFANAIRQLDIPVFKLLHYEERSLGTTVNADSITVVSMERQDGIVFYGVGLGTNIVQGAARAIISGINRMS